jgi:hypothetical protein
MSVMKVFSVRDSKAAAYMQPFFSLNEATAHRACGACLIDSNHPFYSTPEDYSLYILGEYDDSSGKFTLLDAPEHLFNLIDLANNADHELTGE